jgi:hypothetical protein
MATAEASLLVPGPAVTLRLQPGAPLQVTVPDLVGAPRSATLQVLSAAGRPHRVTGWGTEVRTEFSLTNGEATVPGLSTGSWIVRATSSDGRSWGATVTAIAGETTSVTLVETAQ